MVQTGNQVDLTNGYSSESGEDVQITGIAQNCPHISKSCDSTKLRKALKTTGILKDCPQCDGGSGAKNGAEGEEDETEYEYDENLWICLQCGIQLCGRAKNQHALAHNTKPHSDEHNLALSTAYLNVWCYKCDASVLPTASKKLQNVVDLVKREKTKNTNHQQAEQEKNTFNNSLSASMELVQIIPQQQEQQTQKLSNSAVPRFDLESLPRVRGLSNLGNTCFYNAVLQCLSQTPFLLEILKESGEPGEQFTLPGGKLKLENGEEVYLIEISGTLNTWGNLTSVLAETLEQLQSGGGVYTPSALLKQLSAKWPQFGSGDQQDSHELLRHLLESVRCEDLRRYQSVILKLLGYSSKSDPSLVEDTVKQKIKHYGQQVQERILRPEQVFRGFLVSTLTCQDCYNTSSRHESFLDISLPILTEKPHPPMRRKSSPEPPSKHQTKKAQQIEKRRQRALKKQQAKAGGNNKDNNATKEIIPPQKDSSSKNSCSGSDQTDGDVEDNDDDSSTQTSMKKQPQAVVDDNGNSASAEKEIVRNEIVELGISSPSVKLLMMAKSNAEQMEELSLEDKRRRRQRTYSAANWSTTLAPKYQCEDGECSVQSCLNNFTWTELMTGNNKVTCDACTEKINGKGGKPVQTNATKQLLISSPPAVLILHLKRFQVGPRGMFRKITKHVTFPLVLDIAPFCASKVKKLDNIRQGQKQLPYSLYGVVEHSGTMHGGHYVAYVKVRQRFDPNDPRWSFVPKGSRAELKELGDTPNDHPHNSEIFDESDFSSNTTYSSSSCSSGGSDDEVEEDEEEEVQGAAGGAIPQPKLPNALPGKWYYVSDSRVSAITEAQVLETQAYLLFYERIDIEGDAK